MDPSRENPRENLRQAIDAEIKSLEESAREAIQALRPLRHRRNALAPISSLPTEVITAIFSFLHVRDTSLCERPDQPDRLAWLRVAHVCHQWREIALNNPLFWCHVDFTTFSPAGAAQILALAKKAPLYLEARVPSGHWDDARFTVFQEELQDRVSHICHLTIGAGPFRLDKTLKGLISPAPTLECLSLLSHEQSQQAFVPHSLFGGTAPRLSCLELWRCDIGWQSPLLRGLKHLHIRRPFSRPSLSLWLDALDEMEQLKTLVLHWASPTAPPGVPPDVSVSSDIERTVILSSLSLFEICSSARDCLFALDHLILPALTSLCLIVKVYSVDSSDALEILPYLTRHAHGLQPLQSMFFRINGHCTEILAWTLPDIDVELPNFDTDVWLPDLAASYGASARVGLSVVYDNLQSLETNIGIFDAVIAALPLSLVTLTAQCRTDKQFWLRHVPRWPRLRRVRLSCVGRGFRKMLLEDDVLSDSPLLPSLTKLVINTALCPRRTRRLCDTLMMRVELGVPLETLDLRTCLSGRHAIELLSEIVVDVLGPEETPETVTQVLSASMTRGINLEDSSEQEDYDEDEPDTGSDDVVLAILEMDDDEYEYESDEDGYKDDDDDDDEDEEDYL